VKKATMAFSLVHELKVYGAFSCLYVCTYG